VTTVVVVVVQGPPAINGIRQRRQRRQRRARRARWMLTRPLSAAAAVVTLGWLVGGSAAYAGHTHGSGGSGLDARYYRCLVTTIEPRVPGLDLTVPDDGELVTLDNRTGLPVEVRGYSGEPYLRVGPDGVSENEVSMSSRLNRGLGSTAQPLPAVAAEPWRTPPSWRRTTAGTQVSWPDFRVRMTTPLRPPLVAHDPGRPQRVFDWTIPLTVGGRPVLVRGEVRWTGQSPATDPTVPAVELTGFLGLVGFAGLRLVRRRRRDRDSERELLAAGTTSRAAAVGLVVVALLGQPVAAPSPTPHHKGSCEVVVGVTPLNGGYLGTVLVYNRDRTMAPWRVWFDLPDDVVLAGWNAAFARDGRTVIADAPGWDPVLRPGGQVSIGFVATGRVSPPPSVILNDITCA